MEDDILGHFDAEDTPPMKEETTNSGYSGGYKQNNYSSNGGYNKGSYNNGGYKAGNYSKGSYNGYKKPFNKQPSMWEKTDIQPLAIDVSNQKHDKLRFSIMLPKDLELSEEIKGTITGLATTLASKGFVYRFGYGSTDTFQNNILSIFTENNKDAIETFLPWRKFNEGVENAILTQPNEIGYRIAAGLHKLFPELKNGLRAILSNNVHICLGENGNQPLSMLIIYNECGTEVITKNTDFKKLGNLVFFLQLAAKANIPVFNVKNPDSRKRLMEHIKYCLTLDKPAEQAEATTAHAE